MVRVITDARLMHLTELEDIWERENPILKKGITAVTLHEEDYPAKLKIGNGEFPWRKLAHFQPYTLSIVEKPTPISPQNGIQVEDTTPILEVSEFDSFFDIPQKSIIVEVAADSRFVNTVHKRQVETTDQNDLRIPFGELAPNMIYYWRVRFKNVEGMLSLWSETQWFRTASASEIPVVVPTILTPINGAVRQQLAPTIVTTEFDIEIAQDTHAASQYQLSLTEDFTDIVYDSGRTGDLTSHTLPENTLLGNRTYHVRARHRGDLFGYSLWSETISFTTVQPIVLPPEITSIVEDGQYVPTTPFITTSDFETSHGFDLHVESQFQISQLPDFSDLIYDVTVEDPEPLKRHDVPEGILEPLTTYRIRARHRGQNFGWSNWSDIYRVSTRPPDITIPSILSPDNMTVDVGLTPTIEVTELDVETTTDIHIKTHYQISETRDFFDLTYDFTTEDDLLSHTLPPNTIQGGIEYFVRARLEGDAFGWSPWSPIISFTTRVPVIVTPTIISPTDEATDISLVTDIEISPFTIENGTDTHIGTRFQITDVENLDTPVYDNTHVKDIDTYTIPRGILEPDTTYRLRVQYLGEILGPSKWSETITFTTAIPFVETPSILKPSAFDEEVVLPLEVITSNFRVNKGEGVHETTQYQITVDPQFEEIVYDVAVNDDLIEHTVPSGTLDFGEMYYIRARHRGEEYGWSEWSVNNHLFMTRMPEIDVPDLTVTITGNSYLSDDLRIQLSTGPFGVVGGEDVHEATHYQVATDTSFDQLVFERQTSNSLREIVVPTDVLDPETTYASRVRFIGERIGPSVWSAIEIFETPAMPMIITPDVHVTVDGETYIDDELRIRLQTSPFTTVGDEDTHISTRYQVAPSPAFTETLFDTISTTSLESIDVPLDPLSPNTMYYARVQYTGQKIGETVWSQQTPFTTPVMPSIITPNLTVDITGDTYIDDDFSIQMSVSDFDLTAGEDEHLTTRYQIATDNTFDNLIVDTISSSDLQNFTVPLGQLNPNTNYVARSQFESEKIGNSNWSPIVSFQTLRIPDIITPSVSVDILGDTYLSDDLEIQLSVSDFTLSEGQDTHIATRYQVSRDPNFTSFVMDTTSSTDLQTFTLPTELLDPETEYFVRILIEGEKTGQSAWSPQVTFTTPILPEVITPDVTANVLGETYIDDDFQIQLSVSEFNVTEDTGVHVSTRYQVSRNAAFTDLVVDQISSTDLRTFEVPLVNLDPETEYFARVLVTGEKTGESDWSPTITFTTLIMPDVITPTVTANVLGDTYIDDDFQVQLSVSEFALTLGEDAHTSTRYQISRNADFTDLVVDQISSTDLRTFEVPLVNLDPETDYFTRVSVTGEATGESAWSPLTTFTTLIMPDVLTPSVTANVLGDTYIDDDFQVQLSVSEFALLQGTDDHVSTRYQVSRNADFSDLVVDQISSTDLRTFEVPLVNLDPDTDYFARVLVSGEKTGQSAWSPQITFTTLILPEVITPDVTASVFGGTYIDDDFQIQLSVSEFAISTGTDAHASTRYQVSRNADFTDLVVDQISSTDLRTFEVPLFNLDPGTNYFTRVLVTGEKTGDSAWSPITTFTTLLMPDVLTPSVTANVLGDTYIDDDFQVQLSVSEFALTFGEDAHTSTRYQISRNADFSDLVVDQISTTDLRTFEVPLTNLDSETDYFTRVLVTGEKTGDSEWSPLITFTTLRKPDVVTPSVSATIAGISYISDNFQIQLSVSEFSLTFGQDAHASTRYQIALDSAFTDLVVDQISSTDLRTFEVPLANLNPNTDYFARVLITGEKVGDSAWSSITTFTTLRMPNIDTPSVSSSITGTSYISDNFQIQLSVSEFSLTFDEDTHVSTRYQIALDNGFTDLVVDQISSTDLRTFIVPLTRLTPDTSYFTRVLVTGEKTGDSSWSSASLFTTLSVPEIITPGADVSVNINVFDPENLVMQLTGSEFTLTFDSDTHALTRYQLSRDIDFTAPIIDILSSTTLRSIDLPVNRLDPETQYFGRIQYRGEKTGPSAWSTPVVFETPVVPDILTPSVMNIQINDESETRDLSVVMTTSEFATVPDTDTHMSTRYQVSEDDTFDRLIMDTIDSNALRTSRLPLQLLEGDKEHFVRVKHKGRLSGWSDWSTVETFTTPESVAGTPPLMSDENAPSEKPAPSINEIIPTTGGDSSFVIPQVIAVDMSAFDIPDVDHVETQIQLWFDSSFTLALGDEAILGLLETTSTQVKQVTQTQNTIDLTRTYTIEGSDGSTTVTESLTTVVMDLTEIGTGTDEFVFIARYKCSDDRWTPWSEPYGPTIITDNRNGLVLQEDNDGSSNGGTNTPVDEKNAPTITNIVPTPNDANTALPEIFAVNTSPFNVSGFNHLETEVQFWDIAPLSDNGGNPRPIEDILNDSSMLLQVTQTPDVINSTRTYIVEGNNNGDPITESLTTVVMDLPSQNINVDPTTTVSLRVRYKCSDGQSTQWTPWSPFFRTSLISSLINGLILQQNNDGNTDPGGNDTNTGSGNGNVNNKGSGSGGSTGAGEGGDGGAGGAQ